jgi:hypothetical protein
MFIAVWHPAIFLPHITTCFTILLWPLSFFRKGIAVDRLVGFQDLRSKDDFPTRALENILKTKGNHGIHTAALYNLGRQMCWQSKKKFIGIIDEKKKDDDDDDEESEAKNRRVRSSTAQDSDSDWTWDEDRGLTVFALWILFVCLFCVVLYCTVIDLCNHVSVPDTTTRTYTRDSLASIVCKS